jgi:hypothetical protein
MGKAVGKRRGEDGWVVEGVDKGEPTPFPTTAPTLRFNNDGKTCTSAVSRLEGKMQQIESELTDFKLLLRDLIASIEVLADASK